MSLKKKKMFEMQLEQVENNIFRLNEQQNMLEGQRTTVETLVSMQNASRYTMFGPSTFSPDAMISLGGRTRTHGLHHIAVNLHVFF